MKREQLFDEDGKVVADVFREEGPASRKDGAKWPEKAIRAYRRKWREITGVNPPHEGNTTHEYALAAALASVPSERGRWEPINEAPRDADYLSDGMLTVYKYRHDENGDDEQLFKFTCPELPTLPAERPDSSKEPK